jgi:hypothetical protein
MAFEIPYEEPTKFAAGDRVQWKRTLATYPVSEGWTLTYYLRGNFAEGVEDIAAATDGNDYSVDLLPAVTAEFIPGVYHYQAFVAKSGDRKLVAWGKIEVTPNFTELSQPYDGRTHARRCLDSINAVLEGRATHDQQRYVMQAVGRSVDKMPIADLLKFRDYFLAEVKGEEAATNGGKGKNVLIRFLR